MRRRGSVLQETQQTTAPRRERRTVRNNTRAFNLRLPAHMILEVIMI